MALALLMAGILALPTIGGREVPGGIYGRGLINAAVLAFHATGLVLVFRSDRFINFAQIQMGTLGGLIFVLVVQAEPLFRALDAVCPPCMEEPGSVALWANYATALVLGLLVAVAVSTVFYVGVVRRLNDSSRLVVTVASIFAVQAVAGLRDPIVNAVITDRQRVMGIPGGATPPPVDGPSFSFGGATFTTPDVLIVAIALVAVVALAAYLRFTNTGTAIRASSTNRARAETLGINVTKVTSRVWIAVGLLSGAAAILTAMSGTTSSGTTESLNVALLVRILAVVVVARLTSLPLAAAAAIAFGVLDQVVLWVFGTTLPVDGVLVALIGGLLLVQRRDRQRSDDDADWQAARELRPIPAQLRHLPEVRRYIRVGSSVLAIVLLGIPWVMSPSQTNLLTVAALYAIVGLSLLVLTGWGGLVSLGQFALAAVGAWVAAVLGLPLPLALLIGGAAGALTAVLVGLPALKLRGLYLAVTTLAFALATTVLLLNRRYLGQLLPDEVDRPALLGVDFDDQRVAYYVTLATVVLAAIAVSRLRRSRSGRMLIAARDNEALASSIGVSLVRLRLSAFALSGFLAAVAGVLFSVQQGGVQPEAFAPGVSVTLFTFTVIGGFGTIAGPFLGFGLFGIMSLLSTASSTQLLLSGFGGIALMLAAPGGLAQIAWSLRDAMLRRVARRRRLIVPSLIADQKSSDHDRRAPIRPRLTRAGGTAFVPQRYQLDDQWLIAPESGRSEDISGPFAPAEELADV